MEITCNYRGGETFVLFTGYFYQQGVQGLQVFAFCILTVNDEHTKQTLIQTKV